MSARAKKYLSDILKAIRLTEQFVRDTPTFEQYQVDLKTKSAVERQLEILGEAVNKYAKTSSGRPLSNTALIVSFRNRLAHNYDNVDDNIVWAVLSTYLPLLKDEVLAILEE
jgi:uncharacterized protein with HEPN domain